MAITPEEAAQELVKRESAREHLVDFINYTYPSYIAEPAHIYICNILEKFASGQIKRLILTAPPRFGKSEIVSIRFPAWFLGKYPGKSMILCSYTADLASELSRQARDLVESDKYSAVFPSLKTSDDTRAADNWNTIYRNTNDKGQTVDDPLYAKFLAAGIGGGITGFGATRAIVDDPIKNWEEANSETLMEKYLFWYKSVLKTRLTEDGSILIMCTRWSQNDLVGRLLLEAKEPWAVVRLPAISETQEVRDINNKKLGLREGLSDPILREPNEPLTPKRYSINWLQTTKEESGELVWQAMYQGVPTSAEGLFFKRGFFHIIPEELDENGKPTTKNRIFIRYWDKAASEDMGCYTAGVLMSYNYLNRKFRVEDVKRVQYSALARERLIRRTAEADSAKYGNIVEIWTEQEPGSGGKESAENTVANLVGFTIFVDKVTGSKDARLQGYLSQAAAGNLELISASWNRDFIEEHIEIPNGIYRDQSDAASGAFNKIILKRAGKTIVAKPIIAQLPRYNGMKENPITGGYPPHWYTK